MLKENIEKKIAFINNSFTEKIRIIPNSIYKEKKKREI